MRTISGRTVVLGFFETSRDIFLDGKLVKVPCAKYNNNAARVLQKTVDRVFKQVEVNLRGYVIE
jgi:hypothetical protein